MVCKCQRRGKAEISISELEPGARGGWAALSVVSGDGGGAALEALHCDPVEQNGGFMKT